MTDDRGNLAEPGAPQADAAPDAQAARRTIVLHLVSPISGDLVELLARTLVAQLVNVQTKRHFWQMVRNPAELEKVLAGIEASRGFVLHTLLDPELRAALEAGCARLGVPCLFVLEPFVTAIARHFEVEVRYRASPRVVMDEAYARRLEAMRYTLGHDDGLGLLEIEKADVVLLGASRVTKTPTCMYLAHRGVKAANVSLLPGVPLPEAVVKAKRPLRVGLTLAPAQLAQIRRERSEMLRLKTGGAYDDVDAVRAELTGIRRLIARQGWPIIDVTHRSIDQTASVIMELLKRHRAAPD